MQAELARTARIEPESAICPGSPPIAAAGIVRIKKKSTTSCSTSPISPSPSMPRDIRSDRTDELKAERGDEDTADLSARLFPRRVESGRARAAHDVVRLHDRGREREEIENLQRKRDDALARSAERIGHET